jgi:hypothetical protein
MERPHGIGVLLSGCQGDNGASAGNLFRFKSDQPCYRNVVRLRISHKPSLAHHMRNIPAVGATGQSLGTTVARE